MNVLHYEYTQNDDGCNGPVCESIRVLEKQGVEDERESVHAQQRNLIL